jgi:hypothetical protein
MLPYTTRQVFEKEEQDGVDYKSVGVKMFLEEQRDWFVREELEGLALADGAEL